MTRRHKNPGRGSRKETPPFLKVFGLQLAVLVGISALLSWQHQQAAWSLFLGGLIQCVPNWYFASQVFKFSGAAAAHRVTQSVYRGEAVKFVLTGVGFALAFTSVENVSPPALFAGFGLMTVGHVMLVPLLNR